MNDISAVVRFFEAENLTAFQSLFYIEKFGVRRPHLHSCLSFVKRKRRLFADGVVFFCCLLSVNAYLLLIRFGFELHFAVDKCEQSVVAADADVVAGMNGSTPLTDENIACKHKLTVAALYAQTLRMRISAVFGGAAAFLCANN